VEEAVWYGERQKRLLEMRETEAVEMRETETVERRRLLVCCLLT